MSRKPYLTMIVLLTLAASGPCVASEYPRKLITQKSECLGEDMKGYDYSDRLPALRNQGRESSCWMFESATLYSELLCEENASQCKVDISPLSVAFSAWNHTQINDWALSSLGGGSDKHLKTLLADGVCEEKDEPYAQKISIISQFFDETSKAKLEKISEKDLDKYSAKLASRYQSSTTEESEITAVTLRQWKQDPSSRGEFLSRNFESPACQSARKTGRLTAQGKYELFQNSLQIAPLQVAERSASRELYMRIALTIAQQIRSQLKSGSSAGIGLYLPDEDATHAVVISGLRWNDHAKRCEYYIRNSGWDYRINGWQEVDPLIPRIFDVVGYRRIK